MILSKMMGERAWIGIQQAADSYATVPPLLGVVGVVLCETVLTWALVPITGGAVWLAGLLIMALILAGGEQMWWGVGLGEFVGGTVTRSVSVGVGAAIAASMAALVCHRLWTRPPRGSARWVAQYLGVATITVISLAVMYATFSELYGWASFSVKLLTTVWATLPATLVGLPTVWLLTGSERVLADRQNRQTRIKLTSLVLLWAIMGYVASFLFIALGNISPERSSRRLSPAARRIYEVTGAGRWVLVSLGVGAVLAFLYIDRNNDIGQ